MMVKTMVRKLMRLFATLIVLSMLAFATIVAADEMKLFHLLRMIPETDWALLQSLTTHYGLEKPVSVQYFLWLSRMVQGDWGWSLLWERPVADVVLMTLGRTLAIFTPLVVLFCGLSFALWMHREPRRGPGKGFGLRILPYLRAIPMFLWALALFFVAWAIFGFDSHRPLRVLVEDGIVWDLPHLLNLLSLLAVPALIVGGAILAESLIARQRWFETAHDALEAFRAKKLSGKDARKAWRRLVLPQLVGVLRDALPGFVSEITLFSIIVYWPTLGPTFFSVLMSGDIRLSAAILFVITGGVAMGCFLLDVWAAWLDRDNSRHLNGAASTT